MAKPIKSNSQLAQSRSTKATREPPISKWAMNLRGHLQELLLTPRLQSLGRSKVQIKLLKPPQISIKGIIFKLVIRVITLLLVEEVIRIRRAILYMAKDKSKQAVLQKPQINPSTSGYSQ